MAHAGIVIFYIPSGCCGRLSQSSSQSCFEETQIWTLGLNGSGLSRLPKVRPIALAFLRSENMVAPHSEQKPRRKSGEEAYHFTAPVICNVSSGTSTRALKLAPMAFWHLRQ